MTVESRPHDVTDRQNGTIRSLSLSKGHTERTHVASTRLHVASTSSAAVTVYSPPIAGGRSPHRSAADLRTVAAALCPRDVSDALGSDRRVLGRSEKTQAVPRVDRGASLSQRREQSPGGVHSGGVGSCRVQFRAAQEGAEGTAA